MSKFSNFVSSLASNIQSSFRKIKPYRKIKLQPKEYIFYLIVLKNGKILAFIKKLGNYDSYTYLYDYEDNYSSPQKFEINLDKYEIAEGIYCSFELENGDLINCYRANIAIGKIEKNNYSLIKNISYIGRVSDIKAKKLGKNRFISTRQFSSYIMVWGRKIN